MSLLFLFLKSTRLILFLFGLEVLFLSVLITFLISGFLFSFFLLLFLGVLSSVFSLVLLSILSVSFGSMNSLG